MASVVQMTHMLLCHGGIIKSKAMDRPLMWGTYWAALVHDYEHGGLNNDFLIKTAHPLAITYSDQSPLEHHHVAAATRVFLEPECMYFTVRSHTPSACISQQDHTHPVQVLHSKITSTECAAPCNVQSDVLSCTPEYKNSNTCVRAVPMQR